MNSALLNYMADPLIFSSSQLSTYNQCKKQHQLAYEMLLEPKRNEDNAMDKGTAFHKWAQFQTTQFNDNLTPIEPPSVDDNTINVWSAWWKHRGEAKHESKRSVLGVESPIYTPLEVDIGGPIACYLRCTFDEIYLDKKGWIVGLDYKTFTKLDPWDVDLDFQGRLYIAALEKLFPGYNVRFEYERVRQVPPGTPRGNVESLRLEGETWWQYNKAGDKRKRAEVWEVDECYETIDLVCPQNELDALWDETLYNVQELMVRRRLAERGMAGTWPRQTNKFICKSCYYKDLCKADLAGTLDEQTILLMANIRTPLEIPDNLKEEDIAAAY